MKTIRTVAHATALPAALLLSLSLIAACGSDEPETEEVQAFEETVYAPQAFGEDGKCYYVDDPAEVATLVDDDLCDPSWAAYPAPMPWLFLYAPYYGSSAYADRYVPRERRSSYKTAATTFQRDNAAEITKAAPLAKYKGSDGQTYTGRQVASNPTGFGNGAKGFGKGAPRACSMSAASVDLGAVEPVAYTVVIAAPGRVSAPAPRPAPAAPRPAAPRSNSNSGPKSNPNKAPAGQRPRQNAPQRQSNPRC